MQPWLTIVTVNLNDAGGLRATAASISPQSARGLEWLILDGGSCDGSQAEIGACAADLATWSSEPDGGVYDAMNKGLARARGEWVIFMNAGDRFAASDSVARICAALATADGADLLLGGTILQMPNGRRVYRSPRSPGFIRFGLPACHQATVFRRRAHLAVPYDPGLRISADYGAVAALLSRGAKAVRLDHPIAVRQCDPASLSERHTVRRLADFVRVQRAILQRGWPQVTVGLARLLATHAAYCVTRDLEAPALDRLITALLAPPSPPSEGSIPGDTSAAAAGPPRGLRPGRGAFRPARGSGPRSPAAAPPGV
jgi:putative colanic acid biosynthesis glycosyltransferase